MKINFCPGDELQTFYQSEADGYVVVQFYPWFKFSFLLFQIIIIPKNKRKENLNQG